MGRPVARGTGAAGGAGTATVRPMAMDGVAPVAMACRTDRIGAVGWQVTGRATGRQLTSQPFGPVLSEATPERATVPTAVGGALDRWPRGPVRFRAENRA